MIPYRLLCYGCDFQIYRGSGCFEFQLGYYFFSFCQPAHDLKKLAGKKSSGGTKFIKTMILPDQTKVNIYNFAT